MKKNFVLAVFISALLTGGSLAMAKSAGQEVSANEAKLAKQAKITRERAQQIALKRAPGTVENGELEKEHGRLVYSFDIRNAKGNHRRVQVSAITGRVVRVEHETRKQEEAEKRKESKENKH